MNRKMLIRGLLDLLMLLLAATLYQKQAVSMAFHEIAGLALFACFALHLFWNRRWIAGRLKKQPGRPPKAKIIFAVNLLLTVCWALVLVSGVLISKVVFHFSVPGPWKVLHFFTAALALILTGIHAGLHWDFFKSLYAKGFGWLQRAARPLGAVCVAALVLFGAYSVADTDFLRWLAMPFAMTGQAAHGQPPEGGPQQGQTPPEASTRQQGRDAAPRDGGPRRDGQGQRGDGQGQPRDNFAPQEGQGQRPESFGPGENGMRGGPGGFSLLRLLRVMVGYLSIMVLFAAATRFVGFCLRRKPPKPPEQPPEDPVALLPNS